METSNRGKEEQNLTEKIVPHDRMPSEMLSGSIHLRPLERKQPT